MPNQNNWKFLIYFVFVSTVSIVVFYPSFYHSFREEGLAYFLFEASLYDNIFETIFNTYSYTRTRVLGAGDALAFRPLFYIFMVLEVYFLKYNFFLWQVLSIILHLCVLRLLLRIFSLFHINKTIVLLSTLFSVLYISHELVIWRNISGYLLFAVFLLSAFYHWIIFLRSRHSDNNALGRIILYLTLSCFILETGVAISIVILIFSLIHRNQFDRMSVKDFLAQPNYYLLLIPAMAYCFLNLSDLNFHKTAMSQINLAGGSWNIKEIFLALPLAFLNVFYIGIVSLLFPSIIKLLPNARSYFHEFNWQALFNTIEFGAFSNLIITACLAGLTYLFILHCNNKKPLSPSGDDQFKENLIILLSLFFFCLAVIYVGILACGRLIKNPFYINMSLYHFYFIDMFIILALAFFIIFLVHKFPVNNKRLVLILDLILIGLILINGLKTFQMNEHRMIHDSVVHKYISELNTFINKNDNEKDFSFLIVRRDVYAPMIVYYDETSGKIPTDSTWTEMLYYKYIDYVNPKYWLVYTRNAGINAFRSSSEAIEFYEREKGEIKRSEQ